MPRKCPEEFERNVVAVARRGDHSVAEIASGFDLSTKKIYRWMRQADVDDGIKDGPTTAQQAESVRLRREVRRLEMENEIVRRAAACFARDALPKKKFPLVQDLAAEGFPVRLTCGVLDFSYQAFCKGQRQPCSAEDY